MPKATKHTYILCGYVLVVNNSSLLQKEWKMFDHELPVKTKKLLKLHPKNICKKVGKKHQST